MSQKKFATIADDLPAILPVFPLGGALLLPRARLPLNIFEPRYIAMVDDALAAGRLIGMIQPQENNSAGEPKNPPLFSVGCAGRIVSFGETDDERYLLVLQGVTRFRIKEEMATTRGYRSVVPDWSSFTADLQTDEEHVGSVSREKLVVALRPYFKAHGIMANWDTIDDLSPEKLVGAVAQACPFSATEKQALLEAADLPARLDLLVALLHMGSRTAPDNGEGQQRH